MGSGCGQRASSQMVREAAAHEQDVPPVFAKMGIHPEHTNSPCRIQSPTGKGQWLSVPVQD